MRSSRVRVSRGLLPSLALSLTLAGCVNSPGGPSVYAPFSQTDLTLGTGDIAANGASITVDYTGWLYDPSQSNQEGLQFDTSIGRAPYTFTLGGGNVISGWDKGLVGMRVGGVRRLIIPPSLAYGGTRSGPIPPYSTLVFEVKLLSVTGP